MNEFNEEELEYLYDLLADKVDCSSMKGIQEPDICYDIKHKLSFMKSILNKQQNCQHEWQYEFNDYYFLKCELRK
jgi:hypothetical protein